MEEIKGPVGNWVKGHHTSPIPYLKHKSMKRFRLFPKRKKKEVFSYADFEAARAENSLLKELHISREKQKRTRHEMDEILRITKYCNDIVMRHSDEIPQEDFAYFMLYEGLSAFLPISIKEHLGAFEGMIIMYNPYREAKIVYT